MANILKMGGTVAVVTCGMALAGCQSVGSYQPDIAFAGESDQLVTLTHPEFKGTQSRHVVFTDMWQREEYSLFQGGGAQAEVIYIAADERDTVALSNYLTVERTVNTWNIARNNQVIWGAPGVTAAPLGDFFYKRFQLAGVNRNCVGFSTEWDERSDDPYHRYSKTLFGYYCAPPGAGLDDREIPGLMSNIWIRGITARFASRFTPIAPSGPGTGRAGAAQFVKVGSGNTGNAVFPFDMADYFHDYDGEDNNKVGG